jgi:hypothetical protein
LALTSMKAGKGPAARRRRRQAKKEDSGTPRSWQNRATGRPLASCSSMTSRQRARADSDRLLMPPIFAAGAEARGDVVVSADTGLEVRERPQQADVQ